MNSGKEQKKSPRAKAEEKILQFWKENNIFKKTLEKLSPEGEFIFYEGPPTANGHPGIHHLESRAFKDIIPRYKTMRGFHVGRKGGWDTHGLPVELEVEKQLGLKSKKEIETYGIAAFNKKCRESVWKYIDEWKDFTDRAGYWIDLENPYITYKSDYIESLWSIVRHVHEGGLLYKDYKVVPWCPRCGTALSSHEIAQGYKDVTERSVYVLFKAKNASEYFMAWTTTPWTLPGNVALAVHPKLSYVKAEIGDQEVWLSKDRLSSITPGAKVLEEVKGKELVGREYEPLFSYLKNSVPASEKNKIANAYKVYPANFVTTEDGTGIVHTAVMYGADDFELGTKENLPKHHLVGEDGKFLDEAGLFAGKFVKDADALVIRDLANRELLLKEENITHTYPFCWRCKTPLIYYARDSWYIAMSKLRDELVKENEKINWEPTHIKEGRFGEWLREVKDWAISRERYWGTPLPVWQEEGGKKIFVPGSIEELKQHTKRSGNTYLLMRHGEATHNVKGVFSSDEEEVHHLTEKGRLAAQRAAEKLKVKKIDLIVHSPLARVKETVEEISKVIKAEIISDQRLREEGFGSLSGTKNSDFIKHFPNFTARLDQKVGDAETLREVKSRVGEFIYDLEKKYSGKTILIVTHDGPAKLFGVIASGSDDSQIEAIYNPGKEFLPTGDFIPFDFTPLSHNEEYVLDLHRPYIDEIQVEKNGKPLKRTSEVMDVWFDSGAMPFAEDHYPFENKKWIEKEGYPADYIAEAIDQTRGWFYTLHAIGVLLGKGRAYKNVISLGHLLDKEGKKMSKSIGNVVEPMRQMDKYGADALRFWMYSVNQSGESKNYDEKTVDEIVKKVFNLLLNTLSFYELYGASLVKDSGNLQTKNIENVLDKWILARLHHLEVEVTLGLDHYNILAPARALRDFIADLSQWYVRRSRERFKIGSDKDKKNAAAILRYVILELAKLMAPFTPFCAEEIYQKLRMDTQPESVHLTLWPKIDPEFRKEEKEIVADMKEVRRVVSLGLEARARASIKVRQPLAKLSLKSPSLEEKTELIALIKDEVNVKRVWLDSESEEVILDTKITPELEEEGMARDLIRSIQDLRKKKGLKAKDKVTLIVDTDKSGEEFIEKFKKEISKTAGLRGINFEKNEGETVSLRDKSFTLDIAR